ncbi:MAG: phosphate regulon transcriptional regulator PhoB [Arenicellales bacterium]|jgi:two-component system phosphate regulon response regulator PhoB
MVKNTILIIEDDTALNEMLRFMLERNGFQTMQAENTGEADQCIARRIPDAILLDWMLPGIDGVDYARKLKTHPLTADIGIIMVTARGEDEDKIRGLDFGADDYVTKPFSTNELLARIRATIRRSKPQKLGGKITYENIIIDPESHSLRINESVIDIGVKEFELLYLFLRKPDRVYSRTQLLDQVWGRDNYVDERTVDVYIRRLRAILEQYGYQALIKTVRGVGYRLA